MLGGCTRKPGGPDINSAEAARRIGILIAAHENRLDELHSIQQRLLAGDYDTHAGCRELSQEVAIHMRQLWRTAQSRKEFEALLLGRPLAPGGAGMAAMFTP